MRRVGLLAVGTVLSAVAWVAGPASPALAETSPPGSTQTVGECLEAGEVWLHVQFEDGNVLRSECVGKPATGRDALGAADVATTLSSGDYLCTLAGQPDRCPSSFDGQYWHYWHAAGAGAEWELSTLGANRYRPAAGSIEGWCYNAPTQDSCVPSVLGAESAAADRVDREKPAGGSSVASLAVVTVVLVALGAAVLVVRRQRRPGGGGSGGSP